MYCGIWKGNVFYSSSFFNLQSFLLFFFCVFPFSLTNKNVLSCDNPQILSSITLKLLPNFSSYFIQVSPKKRIMVVWSKMQYKSCWFFFRGISTALCSALCSETDGLSVYELQSAFTGLSDLVLTKALFLQTGTWNSGIWSDVRGLSLQPSFLMTSSVLFCSVLLCIPELGSNPVRLTPLSEIPLWADTPLQSPWWHCWVVGTHVDKEDWPPLDDLLPSECPACARGPRALKKKNTCRIKRNGL